MMVDDTDLSNTGLSGHRMSDAEEGVRDGETACDEGCSLEDKPNDPRF